MLDMHVRSLMRKGRLVKLAPDTAVCKAARQMARRNAGAVLVVDGERLVGIFTERDVVFRVVARDLDPRATCLADVMTHSPHTVAPNQSFGYALLLMHQHGFRHLPVVEAGKVVGIVSARSAMDPDLEEFVSEAERRKHYQSKLPSPTKRAATRDQARPSAKPGVPRSRAAVAARRAAG